MVLGFEVNDGRLGCGWAGRMSRPGGRRCRRRVAMTVMARGDGRTGALTLTRTRTKKPSMYKVLMLNDDYTPMEFVVDVLQRIFQKNREEATQIMLHVHQKGVGVCGVYTYEVAETKVTQTWTTRARTSIRCNARWRRSETHSQVVTRLFVPVEVVRCPCCPRTSRSPSTAPSRSPANGGTNTRRSSTCCWR